MLSNDVRSMSTAEIDELNSSFGTQLRLSRSDSGISINSLDICVDGKCETMECNDEPCSCWVAKMHDEFKAELELYNSNYNKKDSLIQDLDSLIRHLSGYIKEDRVYSVVVKAIYPKAIELWKILDNISSSWPTDEKKKLRLYVESSYKYLNTLKCTFNTKYNIIGL